MALSNHRDLCHTAKSLKGLCHAVSHPLNTPMVISATHGTLKPDYSSTHVKIIQGPSEP